MGRLRSASSAAAASLPNALRVSLVGSRKSLWERVWNAPSPIIAEKLLH